MDAVETETPEIFGYINKPLGLTPYPHIVCIGGAKGQRIVVEGTTFDVWALVEIYYRKRMSVEEIIVHWPFLTPAQIFSAITYYLDNSIDIQLLMDAQADADWFPRYAPIVTGNRTTSTAPVNGARLLLLAEPGPNKYGSKKVDQTGWPHMVSVEGVRGGRPVIEGSSIEPYIIVDYYYKYSQTVEELITAYSHLTPADIYATLTYYHDHKAEVDQQLYENSEEHWDKYIAPTLQRG